ncbi:DoxX family protein [Rothia sp. ZJ1223]|uniref:DoxX family protein n=1 Tax=Rothia sp. ZJ1223 TaxID=2811098 RepID=UPI00195C09BA|nr:DoxX family protein [Rothia sp. ZJ1223]MBM7050443.1 DoxX family protein [Rothia sp. ZJ1223]
MILSQLASRTALASIFLLGGKSQVENAEYIGGAVSSVAKKYNLLVEGTQVAKLSGITMATLGTTLALGVAPRTSAVVLAGMLVPTTVIGHPFWSMEDGAEKTNHTISAIKNLSIIGGLLHLATKK